MRWAWAELCRGYSQGVPCREESSEWAMQAQGRARAQCDTYLVSGLWLQGTPGEAGELLWQPVGQGSAEAAGVEGTELLPTGTCPCWGPAPGQERVGGGGLQLQRVQEPLLRQGLGLGGSYTPPELQTAAEAVGAVLPAQVGGRGATQCPHAGLLNEAEGDHGAVPLCGRRAAAARGGHGRAGPAPPRGAGGGQPARARTAPAAQGRRLGRPAGQGARAVVEAEGAAAGVGRQALAQQVQAARVEVGAEAGRGAAPTRLGAAPRQPRPPGHPVGEGRRRASAALLGVEADRSPSLGHPDRTGHGGVRSGAQRGGTGTARRVPSTPEMSETGEDASSGSPETRARSWLGKGRNRKESGAVGMTGRRCPALVAEERFAPGGTAPSKSPPAERSRQGSSRASHQHHCSPLLGPRHPECLLPPRVPGCSGTFPTGQHPRHCE